MGKQYYQEIKCDTAFDEGACGKAWFMPVDILEEYKADPKKTWHCPYCEKVWCLGEKIYKP